MYQKKFKRIFDIIVSFTAIILLLPLMGTIAILIKKNLGSPIIFCQKRPGLNENIFKMYKFRSMTNEIGADGNMLPDEKRLPSFGKWLRSTSLDELPELFNILKGDMSIVGPRPQLIRDMVFMTQIQRQRHVVLPGLTGLAQVNGRNNITWEEKLAWDIQYIKHITFWGDCLIIFKTFFKVFKKENICTNGMDTSEDLGVYLLKKEKITQENYLKGLAEAKILSGEC